MTAPDLDSAMAAGVCSVQTTRLAGPCVRFQTVVVMATPAGLPTARGQIIELADTASGSLAAALARVSLTPAGFPGVGPTVQHYTPESVVIEEGFHHVQAIPPSVVLANGSRLEALRARVIADDLAELLG